MLGNPVVFFDLYGLHHDGRTMVRRTPENSAFANVTRDGFTKFVGRASNVASLGAAVPTPASPFLATSATVLTIVDFGLNVTAGNGAGAANSAGSLILGGATDIIAKKLQGPLELSEWGAKAVSAGLESPNTVLNISKDIANSSSQELNYCPVN